MALAVLSTPRPEIIAIPTTLGHEHEPLTGGSILFGYPQGAVVIAHARVQPIKMSPERLAVYDLHHDPVHFKQNNSISRSSAK
jgi:hypothetical protein